MYKIKTKKIVDIRFHSFCRKFIQKKKYLCTFTSDFKLKKWDNGRNLFRGAVAPAPRYYQLP